MKKFSLTLLSFLAIAAGAVSCSCGDAAKGNAPQAKKTETKNADASQLPNYRYVDLDTIRAAGLSTESAVIVTNADDLPKLHIIAGGIVSTGTPLFKFE